MLKKILSVIVATTILISTTVNVLAYADDGIPSITQQDTLKGIIKEEQPVGTLDTSSHFTGRTWVKKFSFGDDYDVPLMGLVTFEPSARNNWHSNAGGQILIVTGGEGYYQEEGKPARLLHEGDVVEIPANTKHWYGASPNSWFKHIEVVTNADAGGIKWSDPVTDKEYSNIEVSNPGDTATYPVGQKLSSNFTGNAWANMMRFDDYYKCPVMGYVTFAPSARNYWHSHGGVQILIGTSGTGYLQEEGKPAQILHEGDIAIIPAGVKHWHGAAPDSYFTHMAIELRDGTQSGGMQWLDEVTDNEYKSATSGTKKTSREVLSKQKFNELFDDADIPKNISETELFDITNKVILGEVYQDGTLTDKERELICLAVLTTSNTLTILKTHVYAALNAGLTPVEITEAVYQCTPYVGAARTLEAIEVVNDVFKDKGIELPVESQATTTENNRWTNGKNVQSSIYGNMGGGSQPKEGSLKSVNDYLPDYCFGDFYTRTGLSVSQRELLTFCCLCALGDVDGQLKGHIRGNAAVGNDRNYLLAAVTTCMPYIGFPRTLNAISAINEVLPASK